MTLHIKLFELSLQLFELSLQLNLTLPASSIFVKFFVL